VSGSQGATVRIWDLESGQLLQELKAHMSWIKAVVTALAVTGDWRWAIVGWELQTLRLYDLKSGELARVLNVDGIVRAVAITPDGRYAVSASHRGTLELWDLETGQSRARHPIKDSTLKRDFEFWHRVEPDHQLISAVGLMPDGQRAVVGERYGRLLVWDVKGGQLVRMLELDGMVRALAVASDSCLAVTGSAALGFWRLDLQFQDFERNNSPHTFELHAGQVSSAAITPDGRRAVSGSEDGTLRLWDLERSRSLLTVETPWQPAIEVFATADESPGLRIHTEFGESLPVMAVTPDGCRVLAGSDDRNLQLCDIETGQSLVMFKGYKYTSRVQALAVTPNGRWTVVGCQDGKLRVYDLESGQLLRILEDPTGWNKGGVSAVTVTGDGRQAMAGSEDGALRLWDLESGLLLHTLKDQTGLITDAVRAVALTPNQRLAVVCSENGTLRLWDVKSGQLLRTLHDASYAVSSLAITPDGYRIVVGSEDGALRFYDLDSGQLVRTLKDHTHWNAEGEISAVVVTLDGNRAVVGWRDGTLQLRVLESREKIATFTGEGIMKNFFTAPDGRTILAVEKSGRVHILQVVEFDPTKPAIGETKIQLLAQQQFDQPAKSTMQQSARNQVFISYSHEDTKWREDLEKHLKPYLRAGSFKSWSDKQISPGSQWFTEIDSALARTSVAVVLVTPDFIASDFIHDYELGPFLKEAKQGRVKILWVPVRASSYKKTALKDYQAILDPAQPLAGMTDAERDEAWVRICEEIEKALNS
jgi:WD40 repeat protein